MPNELPYLPFFVGDFLVTVSHWPPDRVGAYLLALCYQWEHGGVPADDERELAGILHSSRPTTRRLWVLLQRKFQRRKDGLWWNPRLELIRVEARKQVALSSERGKKGAVARWGKGAQCTSNAQAMPEQCSDDAIQVNPSTTPPTPPARGGSRKRSLVHSEDAEHVRKSKEVKRLIDEEGLSRAEAYERVGYR